MQRSRKPTMVLLYTTLPTKGEALRIVRTLLREKLIGCASIVEPMTSVYRWKRILKEEHEVILLLKTIERCARKTQRLLKELHPYECSCILRLPIAGVNETYFRWLKNALRE